jgi:hypothetical protein
MSWDSHSGFNECKKQVYLALHSNQKISKDEITKKMKALKEFVIRPRCTSEQDCCL